MWFLFMLVVCLCGMTSCWLRHLWTFSIRTKVILFGVVCPQIIGQNGEAIHAKHKVWSGDEPSGSSSYVGSFEYFTFAIFHQFCICFPGKEARRRELKKNKKQRIVVREAVIKAKDPKKVIEELERLDQMGKWTQSRFIRSMIDWLIDCLVNWWIDRLIDWCVDRLISATDSQLITVRTPLSFRSSVGYRFTIIFLSTEYNINEAPPLPDHVLLERRRRLLGNFNRCLSLYVSANSINFSCFSNVSFSFQRRISLRFSGERRQSDVCRFEEAAGPVSQETRWSEKILR